MLYYCTKCEGSHRDSSAKGKAHLEFKGGPPSTITVKPDRSSPNYTGISITDDCDSVTVDWAPEIYTASSNGDFNFTYSIEPEIDVEWFRAHVKKFPQVPYNLTRLKQDACRAEQTAWIRELKDVLMME